MLKLELIYIYIYIYIYILRVVGALAQSPRVPPSQPSKSNRVNFIMFLLLVYFRYFFTYVLNLLIHYNALWVPLSSFLTPLSVELFSASTFGAIQDCLHQIQAFQPLSD